MKRLVDIAVSAAALLLVAPLMALVAAAIVLETGRPVLFRQVRVGQAGREFLMYKFRSMVVSAEPGPHSTAPQDARITRVGRFLRRFSIDELPQLANVLKGDMSLVGPRPDVPAQRANYTADQWAERCAVRPGITGLAQALRRSEASPGERLALDLQYVREHSLCLDLKIVGWTLRRASGEGSN